MYRVLTLEFSSTRLGLIAQAGSSWMGTSDCKQEQVIPHKLREDLAVTFYTEKRCRFTVNITLKKIGFILIWG